MKRQAHSMLELQVALVVLGLALTGLFPLMVMQSRLQKQLEERFESEQTHYVTPSVDAWARKLGAAGTLSLSPPGPAPPPAVLVLDNGSAGYSEVGTTWLTENDPNAFGGTLRYHPAGTGANSASFSFTSLQPGWYQVWATWTPGTNRAKNAPYTAWEGSIHRGTFVVRQNVPPKDQMYGGRPWDLLGLVPLASTTLEVRLTDDADGNVVADGVWLVPVRNTVHAQSMQRHLTDEVISVQVAVTVVTP